MKVKKLEVKDLLLWLSKLTNNPRKSINQPAFLSKIQRHLKSSASERRNDKKQFLNLPITLPVGTITQTLQSTETCFTRRKISKY